jgi:hypothetical protein
MARFLLDCELRVGPADLAGGGEDGESGLGAEVALGVVEDGCDLGEVAADIEVVGAEVDVVGSLGGVGGGGEGLVGRPGGGVIGGEVAVDLALDPARRAAEAAVGVGNERLGAQATTSSASIGLRS